MKKINKFYCSATHISGAIAIGENADWTHPTLDKAIDHAKELLEEQDMEVVAVVEIIRLVRRKSQPIVVEKV